MSRMRAAHPARPKIFAGVVAAVLILVAVMNWAVRGSRVDNGSHGSPVVPEKTAAGPAVSLDSSAPVSPQRIRDSESSTVVPSFGRGVVAFRDELPLPAAEVGREVLIRYRDQQCWELVVSDILDLSGAAWGAIFRRSDGSEVAFALALPTVLGREPGPGNPTMLSEVLIDVGVQRQEIAGD